MPKPNNLTLEQLKKQVESEKPVVDRISALLRDPSFTEELRKALGIKE